MFTMPKGKVGFQKGNKLYQKREQRISIPTDDLGFFIENGGMAGLVRILTDLMNGVEVTKEERLFLDYFKDYLPYKLPKMASVENKLTPETVELFKMYLPKRDE